MAHMHNSKVSRLTANNNSQSRIAISILPAIGAGRGLRLRSSAGGSCAFVCRRLFINWLLWGMREGQYSPQLRARPDYPSRLLS